MAEPVKGEVVYVLDDSLGLRKAREEQVELARQAEIANVDMNQSRPPMPNGKTILELSVKETADWLSGQRPIDWMAHLQEPAMQKRYDEHKARMREASLAAVVQFARALSADSPQTHERMMQMVTETKAGDARSSELLIVMIVNLMRTGFGLGAL